MPVPTKKINLPCCDSVAYLSLVQKSHYYLRTCTNVMCGKKWDIQRRERGFFCTLNRGATHGVTFGLTNAK
jgi:hypothetical protein